MEMTLWMGFGIYCVRVLTFTAMSLTVYYLLLQMDIKLTIAQALIFMPLFVASTFLPISAGGYGGPQGAAILFLVQLWEITTTEQALAFSIVWSTLFLLGRAVFGGLLVIPYWRLVHQSEKNTGDSV